MKLLLSSHSLSDRDTKKVKEGDSETERRGKPRNETPRGRRDEFGGGIKSAYSVAKDL